MKIFQGQFTIVQLAVRKDFVDQILYQALNSGRRWVCKGSGCGFDGVRQHHQPGFPGLRYGPRIPENVDIYSVFAF